MFARIRSIFSASQEIQLYNRIQQVPSRNQRDELLVMAQRAEIR
ncbi:hypothetical protein [Gordonia sp. CPCC 205333]